MTKSDFRPNLKNYTGSDAAIIYIYDNGKADYSLVTYAFNDNDQCYEKTDDKQLVMLKIINNKSPAGVKKFTIKAGGFYAVKNEFYYKSQIHISSKSFIPEKNKSYYLNFNSVVVIPENSTPEYINNLPLLKEEAISALHVAKVWDIKNKTCSNFWSGRL